MQSIVPMFNKARKWPATTDSSPAGRAPCLLCNSKAKRPQSRQPASSDVVEEGRVHRETTQAISARRNERPAPKYQVLMEVDDVERSFRLECLPNVNNNVEQI